MATFFSVHFASLFVFVLSFGSILLLDFPSSALRPAIVVGFVQSLLAVGLRHWAANNLNTTQKRFKALYILFVPRPYLSIGAMLLGIISFIGLLSVSLHYSNSALLQQMMMTGSGFLAASSLVGLMSALLLGPQYKPTVHFQMDNGHAEMFLAAAIATSFLGLTFSHLPAIKLHAVATGLPHALVLLPMLLALFGALAAFGLAFAVDLAPIDPRGRMHTAALLSALLLAGFAWLACGYLLPETWAKNGKEFTAKGFQQLSVLAILGGLAAGKFANAYNFFAKRYVEFLLNYPFRSITFNVAIRLLINGLVGYLPTLMVSGIIWYAFAQGGLYGASLAMMGVASNFGVGGITVANSLMAEKWQHLSHGARRKLKLVSPSLGELWLRYQRAR